MGEFKEKIIISIHAPTRGATNSLVVQNYSKNISIHAPTRGATRLPCVGALNNEFQSTLLQEERPEL